MGGGAEHGAVVVVQVRGEGGVVERISVAGSGEHGAVSSVGRGRSILLGPWL